MAHKSTLSGFHRLSLAERRASVADRAGLRDHEVAALAPESGLSEAHAAQMVENAIGVLGMPLGVAVNLVLDGREMIVPMAVEEPSVIAACSYASKLLRAGGGVTSTASPPHMVGQIQVLDVPDAEGAERAILAEKESLIAWANQHHHSLVAAGGGAIDVEVRHLPKIEAEDPCGAMLIVHVVVDCRDAMGANAINTMCERLAPKIAELSGGRVGLRILTNLSDRRTVTVTGTVPFAALEGQGKDDPRKLAKAIEEASVFAERDPHRACTHNKGIMNGVDAVLVALGQDFRAVEAGAHAYAARSGRYTALSTWRVTPEGLTGRMEIPLAVGTVGGVVRVHPVVQVTRRILGAERADELARVAAAIGLAQNLAAIRALAAEGIQKGHMRMHARNVAAEAGATELELELVSRDISERGDVTVRAAKLAIVELRKKSLPGLVRPTPTPGRVRPKTPVLPPVTISANERAAPAATPQTISNATPLNEARLMEERSFGGKVLVTGAAGHLGANLVHRLVREGREVRVLLRQGSVNTAVDGLDVERVFGDLRERDSVRRAVRGCETVFHVAAKVSTTEATEKTKREIWECNVLGTQNLLRACLESGVARAVVTGSLSAVGYDADDPSKPTDETAPFFPFDEHLPYGHTKVLMELETLRAVADGLDAVIATSCAILGPHDHKPSRMGRTLMDFANGKLPAYLPGGFEFVAADDIVDGHLLALRRGRKGQKYIFSTQFMSVDELMEIFEEVSGRKRPRIRLDPRLMAGVAEVASALNNRFRPASPQRFTPAAVRILRQQRHTDTTKAKSELGFVPGSIRRAVHEAYADFARRGLVPARKSVLETLESTAVESSARAEAQPTPG